MSTSTLAESTEKNTEETGDRVDGGGGFPSFRVIVGGLLMVALVVALGMTGGQVRELAGRVTSLEDEREGFERRVDQLRADNKQLIHKLRDYQQVLEVAQTSNLSLSKRVQNREQAVEDLQDSLDSILTEKYATENRLRDQVAGLETVKKDLSDQVVALSKALEAQMDEIEQLNRSYAQTEHDLNSANESNQSLLAENDRYLNMMSELQDQLESLQKENRIMVESYDNLISESKVLEQEKVAIQQELDLIKNTAVDPFSFSPPAANDPFGGEDPFGVESQPETPGDDASDLPAGGQEVASAEDGGSA